MAAGRTLFGNTAARVSPMVFEKIFVCCCAPRSRTKLTANREPTPTTTRLRGYCSEQLKTWNNAFGNARSGVAPGLAALGI